MVSLRRDIFLLIAVWGSALMAVGNATAQVTYAERLGWPPGSRVVIFHVDDVGATHDANVGAIEAVEKGVATSLSVMYPCPWVSEIAKYLRKHPEVDAGIHITLTSEYGNYRWGPLAGKGRAPSLVDPEGCFWGNLRDVAAHTTPDAVEAEIRAQLDRCLTLGLKPTHLDTHMGTVFANNDFLQRYMNVGIEAGIPVMVPGGHLEYLARDRPWMALLAQAIGAKVWEAGLPVLDDLHMGSFDASKPADRKAQIIQCLRTLRPGLTQFIVHCTRPTETFRFISNSGPIRLAELEAMTDPEVRKVIAEEKIILTTWRELKQRRDAVKARDQRAQPNPR